MVGRESFDSEVLLQSVTIDSYNSMSLMGKGDVLQIATVGSAERQRKRWLQVLHIYLGAGAVNQEYGFTKLFQED